MAHFCKIDENNTVVQVIVVSNDDCDGGEFPASEVAGQEFIASIGLDGNWKQTSYNRNFRKQYGMIGYTYDEIADVFIEPQPFPSWTKNAETYIWEAPVAYPTDGKLYSWNEAEQTWDEVSIPE